MHLDSSGRFWVNKHLRQVSKHMGQRLTECSVQHPNYRISRHMEDLPRPSFSRSHILEGEVASPGNRQAKPTMAIGSWGDSPVDDILNAC
jgi:hypothetical protein